MAGKLKFCVAEGCYVKRIRWFKITGAAISDEVLRRALIVIECRSLKVKSQSYFEFIKQHDWKGGYMCESCRYRIEESISMDENVVSLRSNVEKGGNGLFALIDFEKGDFITKYGGDIMTTIKVTEALKSGIAMSHFMGFGRQYAINGLRNYQNDLPGETSKGLAQFINKWSDSKDECNVVWVKNPLLLSVTAIASRAITAGTELIADYKIYDTNAVGEERLHVKKKKSAPASLVPLYGKYLMSTEREHRKPDVLKF
jgi:hypothetical protein